MTSTSPTNLPKNSEWDFCAAMSDMATMIDSCFLSFCQFVSLAWHQVALPGVPNLMMTKDVMASLLLHMPLPTHHMQQGGERVAHHWNKDKQSLVNCQPVAVVSDLVGCWLHCAEQK